MNIETYVNDKHDHIFIPKIIIIIIKLIYSIPIEYRIFIMIMNIYSIQI